MKKTIGAAIFVILLPVIVIAVVVFINSRNQIETVATEFPFQPEKVINKKWIAVIFKTACPHCKYILADLSGIYSNNTIKEFEIYAISTSSKENTDEFLSNYEIPFPIIYANEELREQLKVRSVPAMFFIDENNMVKHKMVGRKSKQFLEEVLSEYFESGKILMSSLSSISYSTKNSQFNDIWKIIQQDTSLIDISNKILDNKGSTIELLLIKRKNDQDIIYNFTSYYPNCECNEEDAEDFTYFSVIVDGLTKTIIDQYYSESIYKDEIAELIKHSYATYTNYAN